MAPAHEMRPPTTMTHESGAFSRLAVLKDSCAYEFRLDSLTIGYRRCPHRSAEGTTGGGTCIPCSSDEEPGPRRASHREIEGGCAEGSEVEVSFGTGA